METRYHSIKRVTFALILGLLFAVEATWATSVSGKLVDITETAVPATNALVRVELLNFGSNLPRTGNSVIAARKVDLKPDSAGNFSGTLVGNDQISPAGTFYRFCVWSKGSRFRCADFRITGSTLDLDSATPITTAPTVPAPTGDDTYLRLDGGNKPTGNIVPNADSSQSLGSSGARWEGFFDKLSLSATSGNDVLLFSGSGVDGVGFDQYGNIRANPNAGSYDNWGVFDKNGHGILKVYTDGTGVVKLYTPLPVTSGGTGTTTPSLVAGQNIGVSGSWPNQTIAVTGKQGADANLLTAGTVSGTGSTLCTDANGGATTSGCTSSGSSVIAKVDLTNQTAAIGTTTIYTPSADGLYRITWFIGKGASGAWLAGYVTLSVTRTYAGLSNTVTSSSIAYNNAVGTFFSGAVASEVDGGSAVTYRTNFSGVTGTPSYDVHIRIEKVE